MRRSDHPSRPSAMTCCFFSSLKTLLTMTERNLTSQSMSWLSYLVGRFSGDPHWPVLGDPRGVDPTRLSIVSLLERAEVLPKFDRLGAQFMYRAPDNTLWLAAGGGATNGLWHETLSHQRPTRGSKQQEVREALWRFSGRDWDFVELPREAAGQEIYLQAITQDRAGGIWVSYGRHGLYRLADGVWSPYGGRKDLPKTGVVIEFTDSLGRVWFGCTKNTLAVLDGDRVQVFGPNDGLRVGNITAIYGRGSEIWIGGEFGLQRFDHGRFHEIHATNEQWLRGISGIVETANGDLWLNGLGGIFHVRQSELSQALKNPSYRVKGDHFGRREGLPGFAHQLRPLNTAVEGTDGRLWFATSKGVVWLDPTRSEKKVPPPPLTIESISADDKNYPLVSDL